MKNLTEEQFKALAELADTLQEISEYKYKPVLVHKNCVICEYYKITSGNLINMNLCQKCELALNVDTCGNTFKLLPMLEPW